MELVNTLKNLKNDLVNYIIDVANEHTLQYLYKKYDYDDEVDLYYIIIDNKMYITEDIEYRLNSFSIEILGEYVEKINRDISCVLPPYCESGHNHKLIDDINRLYKEQHEDFINILQFLMKRDNEVFNTKNFDIEDKKFIDNQATMILINMCNDDDLQCIISYCKGVIKH